MAVLLVLLVSFSPGADSRVAHLLTGAAHGIYELSSYSRKIVVDLLPS